MIGAIIGDLAAWTWENDHERFYPSLISEKAVLSEYGLSVLATSDALDYNPHMSSSEYQEYIRSWFRIVDDEVVCLSDGAKEWVDKQDYNYNYSTMSIGIALVRSIPWAWFHDNNDANCNLFFEHAPEKEEWYALQFIRKMIFFLRNGFTKDEVYSELGDVFKGCRHDWDWRNQESPIPYVLRAWDAFYNAFDYGRQQKTFRHIDRGNSRSHVWMSYILCQEEICRFGTLH